MSAITEAAKPQAVLATELDCLLEIFIDGDGDTLKGLVAKALVGLTGQQPTEQDVADYFAAVQKWVANAHEVISIGRIPEKRPISNV